MAADDAAAGETAGTQTMGADTAARGERIPPAATLALWRRYRASGDRRLRDRLVITFTPVVRYIVERRLRAVPAHCEVEDLVSCGIEALIRGIDDHDPASGATLEQHLWSCVRRETLDELRRQEAAAAPETGVWEGAAQLRAPPASDPELASALHEAKERFRAAFRALPEREQAVAIMLHVDRLPMRDIAAMLGVTESRVSQIHTQLRRELRVTLADDAPLFAGVA